MNEEPKKDDLLAAFENPETDPTPDIAPVMPESVVKQTQNSIVNPVPVDNMMAPEFQTIVDEPVIPMKTEAAINPVPVNNMMAPEFQTAVNEPAMPVAPEPVATVMPEPTSVPKTVEQNVVETSVIENVVDPAISLAQQEKKNETDSIQDDPKFLKKNFKFILILCGVILAFILLLPKIMGILGTKF